MNLISSIHDAQKDPIAEAYQNIDAQRSPSTDINTGLYSAGWFDGLMGYAPKLPHLNDYWDGYALGYREYCCGLIGVEISAGEIFVEKLRTLMAA